MAYGVLSKPGTMYGPCEGECQHIDCAATRRQVTSPCVVCGNEIGYDTPFYNDPCRPLVLDRVEKDPPMVHARCIDQRRCDDEGE